jgi:class 3 adenylate cyclase
MWRKRSKLFSLVLLMVVFYAVANYYHQEKELKDNYSQLTVIKENEVAAFIAIGRQLGETGHWDELQERLNEARKYKFFDFYILQRKGIFLWGESTYGSVDKYKINFNVVDKAVFRKECTYYTTAIGEYKLTIGVVKDFEVYKKAWYQDEIAGFMTVEILIIFVLILGVGYWVLRDVMKIASRMKDGRGADLGDIKTNSYESEMMARSLSSFSNELTKSEEENRLYANQLLPSLRTELKSGQKPPYDFHCTMVRTDINNFSQIYSKHNVDELMSTINDFFTDVTHIVSRYEGFVHEFLGDEVIFYFKDQHHQNSFQTALAAVRDIQKAAEKYSEVTTKERGYPFTIKSSLAHGSIRFGPLVKGYTLAGAVLIETVRILSHVVEKNGNVIYVDSPNLKRIGDFCSFEEAVRVQLKGMDGQRTLYSCRRFKTFEQVLANFNEESALEIQLYRSDENIVELIEFLQRMHREGKDSESVTQKAIACMRGWDLTQTDGAPLRSVLGWIEDLLKNAKPDITNVRIVSSLARVIGTVGKQEFFASDIEPVLQRLLTHSDRRVVANALQVLTQFTDGDKPRLAHELSSNVDNRIAGNALIYDGLREITPLVLKRLGKMIHAKSPQKIAAGLYALGEIAFHYRTFDAVSFANQIELHELFSDIPKLTHHEDERVRRQATTALEKIADPALMNRAQAA